MSKIYASAFGYLHVRRNKKPEPLIAIVAPTKPEPVSEVVVEDEKPTWKAKRDKKKKEDIPYGLTETKEQSVEDTTDVHHSS